MQQPLSRVHKRPPLLQVELFGREGPGGEETKFLLDNHRACHVWMNGTEVSVSAGIFERVGKFSICLQHG